MRIHIFEHADFESPGNIIDIAKDKKYNITYTRFYEDFLLPNIDDFDLLIIMGAPMSVNEESEYPWLIEEKKYIRKVIENEKKVLGICFGSQIIADVLGANVYKNNHTEIGWYNIYKDQNNKSSFLSNFANEILTFHWHGDTYNLPEGSLPIFSSQATKYQGFTFKQNVVALQFHWEVKKENISSFIKNTNNQTYTGSFTQKPKDMIECSDSCKSNIKLMEKVLAYFE